MINDKNIIMKKALLKFHGMFLFHADCKKSKMQKKAVLYNILYDYNGSDYLNIR